VTQIAADQVTQIAADQVTQIAADQVKRRAGARSYICGSRQADRSSSGIILL
jgi:hypothetical protein